MFVIGFGCTPSSESPPQENMSRRLMDYAVWQSSLLSHFMCVAHSLRNRLYYTLLCHGQFFLAGFFSADIFNSKLAIKLHKTWDCVGAVCLIVFQIMWSLFHSLAYWFAPFLLAGLLLSVLRGRFFARVFGCPLFSAIGGMCYTIYLYHPPIKSALGKIIFSWAPFGNYQVDTAIQITLHFVVIVTVSSGLFLLFEKPFMNKDWPRSLLFFRMGKKKQLLPVKD